MKRLVLGRLLAGVTVLAAIGFPAAGGAQPASVSAPAAGVTATWSRGKAIDPFTGRPSAVSCPTVRFCVAVDLSGTVVFYDGKSWSRPVSVDPAGGGLTSISCPTTSFCAAVDENDNTLIYDGRSWSNPVNVDSRGFSLASVSCAGARFCVAVDRGGFRRHVQRQILGRTALRRHGRIGTGQRVLHEDELLCRWRRGRQRPHLQRARSWSTPANVNSHGYYVSSISCSSPRSCVAVDEGGSALGVRLRGPGLPLPRRPGRRHSCVPLPAPKASFCAAMDEAGNEFTYVRRVVVEAGRVRTAGGLRPGWIPCPTATFVSLWTRTVTSSHTAVQGGRRPLASMRPEGAAHVSVSCQSGELPLFGCGPPR